MNPFQRLRKAIDKVEINYVIPEEKDEHVPEKTTRQNKTMKLTSTSTKQNDDIQGIWMQKQTQYIQQINRLSNKVEKLQKSNKMHEIQNQSLVKEICQLQKNNELLTQKLQQIGRGTVHWDDKERKYKEEIHRVNGTVSQIGAQLNQQRIAKKNSNADLQKIKEILSKKEQEFQEQNNALKNKISILKEQIEERSNMLEYNIKKSADERRQSKISLESQKRQLQLQLQALRKENAQNRQKICILNGQINLQKQKRQTTEEKRQQINRQNENLKSKVNDLEANINQISQKLQTSLQKQLRLIDEIEQLQESLRREKENVKVKVIHLKDQTLQLELEMYKKQCKNLLQERAIVNQEYVVQTQ